jgi:hypothetical protein
LCLEQSGAVKPERYTINAGFTNSGKPLENRTSGDIWAGRTQARGGGMRIQPMIEGDGGYSWVVQFDVS